ncbi:WD40 repeat-like protein, partial [Patellaria atrata CBS 101060]
MSPSRINNLRPRSVSANSPGVLSNHRNPLGIRRVSVGAVWNVGGSSIVSDSSIAVPDGRGGMIGSGTNAPLYKSAFLDQIDPDSQGETFERRLALALDLDRTERILGSVLSKNAENHNDGNRLGDFYTNTTWKDNQWVKEGSVSFLDAPSLRDDFYCSLLAYSHTVKCLAVGLGSHVYLWSEARGVNTPNGLNTISTAHVTSIAFSSTQGGSAILAVGRADGHITLWSPLDQEPRFDSRQPGSVSCVCFRPTIVKRQSIRDPAITVNTEELLVGDEAGHIYFYAIEWPNEQTCALFDWHGSMTLLARLSPHSQQVCGLAWSPDGEFFTTGANDNICYLFETKKVLANHNPTAPAVLNVRIGRDGSKTWTIIPGVDSVLSLDASAAKHQWTLNAAIKAIAFCPFQRGLIAIGGGSNDRCIHFYHTLSGACLATIDCSAQVTSLVWSTTRREIAATFGFAQPEHPYRIAVFTWPACEQVVAIPWFDEIRALYAIPYPGGPNMGNRGEGGMWWNRTQEEGCLVVATSDCSIKFHEIWGEERKRRRGGGLLGGSDILEGLHGVERDDGRVIR